MKNKASEIIVKAAIKHNYKIYTGYTEEECESLIYIKD